MERQILISEIGETRSVTMKDGLLYKFTKMLVRWFEGSSLDDARVMSQWVEVRGDLKLDKLQAVIANRPLLKANLFFYVNDKYNTTAMSLPLEFYNL